MMCSVFSRSKNTVHFHLARSTSLDPSACPFFRIVHFHFRWTSTNDSFDCQLLVLRATHFTPFDRPVYKIVQFSPFMMALFKDFRTVNFCRSSSFKSLRSHNYSRPSNLSCSSRDSNPHRPSTFDNIRPLLRNPNSATDSNNPFPKSLAGLPKGPHPKIDRLFSWPSSFVHMDRSCWTHLTCFDGFKQKLMKTIQISDKSRI